VQYVLLAVALIAVAVVALWLGWRLLPNRGALPCPTSLASLLDNPFTARYHRTVIARLELNAGLDVLDAGCGPGLLATQIAHAVYPSGRVLALDIQPGMIAKAQAQALQAGLSNIDFLIAPLGAGKLPAAHFDRALLVTVLGEIHDKVAALREISSALKPGGFVSITEVLPDPHYESFPTVVRLAAKAGLHLRNRMGNAFMFTANFEKSLGA
jgi:ubiquinone/menaquinone biosynthesis C-methylase UbiE